MMLSRRDILAAGLAIVVTPVLATPEEMAAAVRAFANGAPVRPGKVRLDVPALVENGNAVPMDVTVDHPMDDPNPVQAIAVFNERNPQCEVGVFTLGPQAARAFVSTRIRLASSQKLMAVARLADGTCWSHTIDVVVTLAACVE
jgi:sulfur-oxidizing protein SoxY